LDVTFAARTQPLIAQVLPYGIDLYRCANCVKHKIGRLGPDEQEADCNHSAIMF